MPALKVVPCPRKTWRFPKKWKILTFPCTGSLEFGDREEIGLEDFFLQDEFARVSYKLELASLSNLQVLGILAKI